MIHRVARVKLGYILRVPDQNGIAQACHIVKIYHSDPEPLVYGLMQPTVWLFVNTKSKRERERQREREREEREKLLHCLLKQQQKRETQTEIMTVWHIFISSFGQNENFFSLIQPNISSPWVTLSQSAWKRNPCIQSLSEWKLKFLTGLIGPDFTIVFLPSSKFPMLARWGFGGGCDMMGIPGVGGRQRRRGRGTGPSENSICLSPTSITLPSNGEYSY